MTPEGDIEELNRVIGQYAASIPRGPVEMENTIALFTKDEKSDISSILHSPEVLQTLVDLYNFPRFRFSTPMSKAWVKKNLMSLNGGVRPPTQTFLAFPLPC